MNKKNIYTYTNNYNNLKFSNYNNYDNEKYGLATNMQ